LDYLALPFYCGSKPHNSLSILIKPFAHINALKLAAKTAKK
jgi:hypothetical protein